MKYCSQSPRRIGLLGCVFKKRVSNQEQWIVFFFFENRFQDFLHSVESAPLRADFIVSINWNLNFRLREEKL